MKCDLRCAKTIDLCRQARKDSRNEPVCSKGHPAREKCSIQADWKSPKIFLRLVVQQFALLQLKPIIVEVVVDETLVDSAPNSALSHFAFLMAAVRLSGGTVVCVRPW